MTSPHGPYTNGREARADLGPLDRAARLAALTNTLAGAGVALEDFDHSVASWIAGVDPATVQTVIGWIRRANQQPAPATPSGTWAIYQPTTDDNPLEPIGIHGTWGDYTEPETLAANVLETYGDGHVTWVVKVFDPDGKLMATAEWAGGASGAPAVNAVQA